MVPSKAARFEDMIMDFSLIHPRSGASKKLAPGIWKPNFLTTATKNKETKHCIPYEQGRHAYLSVMAHT